MNVVAIIQARMGSTRLPGKVLWKFGKYEVLWHVVQRARLALEPCIVDDPCKSVVVAIPSTEANDSLATWLQERNVPFYRGPEDDVLARYIIGAAAMKPDDIILRITGDCPLLDGHELRATLRDLLDHGGHGYVYNRSDVTGSIGTPARGLDIEAIDCESLVSIALHPDLSRQEREHITLRARQAENLRYVVRNPNAHPTNRMRWTLDTPEDAAWFDRLAQHVNTEPPHPTTQEVLDYIAQTGDVLYEPPSA